MMACKLQAIFCRQKQKLLYTITNKGRRNLMNVNAMYWLRDVIACIGPLVGIGGAIFLFLRKKPLPAVLSLIGFVMLAIEPLLDILMWRVIAQTSSSLDWESMSSAYACISGVTMFLGAILIALAFFLGFREPKLPPPPPVDEAGLPPVA
jgi:hypothetical protein